MEGHHSRFKVLCERLKLPALVLQPGSDFPNETVSELANRFAQVLLKKAALNKKFYLLGYESGVLVALEIAAILEESGKNKKFLFLDEFYCIFCISKWLIYFQISD